MGPVESEGELHEYLLSPASSHGFASTQEYEKTLALARRIMDMPHRITFTKPIIFLLMNTVTFLDFSTGSLLGGARVLGICDCNEI